MPHAHRGIRHQQREGRWLESCWRRLLATAFFRSQRADDLLQFPVKQRVVFLPADEVGGDAAGDFRLLAALVVRAEQEAVQVERNQREHFLAPLFHDLHLLLECPVDFAIHPPTGQRRLGGAEQHLVPELDAPVNAPVQVVAGQQLMLVEPAADAFALKPLMQQEDFA